MKKPTSRSTQSRSSKARHKPERGCVRSTSSRGGASVPASHSLRSAIFPNPARQEPRPTKAKLRREFRAWRASLPTALERDTMLTPEWIAESVVQEVERFLKAELPAGFAERLAARAHHLYPRHRHFKKMLNRPGNLGRNNLYVYMRHWTAGWLKRERSVLYKKLPRSFGNGRQLPLTTPGVPKHYPDPKRLVTEDCIKPGVL